MQIIYIDTFPYKSDTKPIFIIIYYFVSIPSHDYDIPLHSQLSLGESVAQLKYYLPAVFYANHTALLPTILYGGDSFLTSLIKLGPGTFR